MHIDSVYAFKAEAGERAGKLRVEARLASIAPQPEVAVGVAAGAKPYDYHVAIRAQPGAEAEAEALRVKAKGEADVRIVQAYAIAPTPEAAVPEAGTPDWLNGERRPLEPGIQISPSRGWVGTVMGLFRRPDGSLVLASNSHVLGAVSGVPKGTPILQPIGGKVIALTAEDIPIVARGNLVDFQLADVRDLEYLSKYALSVGEVPGVVNVFPDDLGRECAKQGRTTGIRTGTLTAFDIDNMGIGYDVGTRYFDNRLEVTGVGGRAFSGPGDSGSMICWTNTGEAFGALDSGGKDNRGVDLTFAGRLATAVDHFHLTLA